MGNYWSMKIYVKWAHSKKITYCQCQFLIFDNHIIAVRECLCFSKSHSEGIPVLLHTLKQFRKKLCECV